MNIHTMNTPFSAQSGPLCRLILVVLSFGWASRPCGAQDVAALKAQLGAQEAKHKQAQADALASAKECQRLKAKLAETGSPVPSATPAEADGSEPKSPDTLGARSYKFLTDELHATLRRSLVDKKLSNLPALFQYTHPGSGDDFWTADMGLQVAPSAWDIADGIAGSKMQIIVDGEYHYSSAAAARKDTLAVLSGLDMRWEGSDEFTYHDLAITGGYKQDDVVAGRGWVAQAVYSPRLGQWNIGNQNSWGGVVSWRLQPYLGYQIESGDGEAEGFTNGRRSSFMAGIALSANLFPEVMGNRLEWINRLSYWHHAQTKGGYDAYDKDQLYWVSSLTYWMDTRSDASKLILEDKDKHFGLQVQYTKGDNPDEGDFAADLLTIGFSLKL